jgi:protein-disulfide isomerase
MADSSSLGRASRTVGYAFLAVAAVIATRPGTPGRRLIDNAWHKVDAKRMIKAQWDELATTGLLLGGTPRDSVVVEFLDYECVFCRMFADSLAAFRQSHPNVGIAIRLVPSRKNSLAHDLALSAVCASEQGALEAIHRELFNITHALDTSQWLDFARAMQIPDPDAFGRCRTSERVLEQLSRDSAFAARAHVSATPAFLSPRHGLVQGLKDNSAIAQLAGASPQ